MSNAPREATVRALVVRSDGGRSTPAADALVVEEPLEIRLRERPGAAAERLLVTMRTPGDDVDLVHGLLFSEGVIEAAADVVDLAPPDDPRLDPELARNVLVATLAPKAGVRAPLPRRATVMGSACGVCGKTSIEEVLGLAARRRTAAAGSPAGSHAGAEAAGGPSVSASALVGLPEALRARQALFSTTGGLHAAALFDADGTLLLVREDVGRHNATDKVLGALLRTGAAVPPILLVSGRLGFEIVQKAACVGVPIVAAVSAPTSLAVALAEEAGITLVGFLRGERFNLYAHPARVAP